MEIFRKSKELRRSAIAALLIAASLMIGMINTQNQKVESSAFIFPGLLAKITIGAICDGLENAVTTKSMNGMVAWVDKQYQYLTSATSQTFFEKFAPDITTFFEMTATDWNAYAVFRVLGTIIAILITVFMFWMIALGALKIADVKETPLQLVGGLFLALSIIFISEQFANFFFDITMLLWEQMKAPEHLNGLDAWTVLYFVLYPVTLSSVFWGTSLSDVRSSENIGQALVRFGSMVVDQKYKPIIAIFNLIIGLIFAKEVLNFMVEIAERYIVSCLLAVFMPVAAGTIPSKVSRSIFGKYLQMFVSQLFLLLMNAVFMIGVLKMVTEGGLLEDNSLTGWIFMYAYLRAAQRVDRYMFTMGLSVAVTGGNVFDSIGSSLRQFGGLLRYGQAGMDAAGGALVRAGVNGLNPGMAQIGRKLKDASHPLKTLSSGEISIGGTGGLLQSAKKLGTMQDTISNLTPEMMDASMAKMAFAGGTDARALSSMAPATKQTLLDNMYGPKTPKLKNISFNQDGTQSGIYVDENGNKAAVTIGGSKGNVVGSLTGQTPDLKGEVFDIHSNGVEMAGTVIGVDGEKDFERASILSGVDINGIEDQDIRDNLDHITINSDGSASLYDGDGDLMARSYKDGMVYDNGNAFDNTDGQFEQLPEFRDLEGVRFIIEPGKFDNMSDAIIHVIGKDSEGTYHDRACYNMAYTGNDFKPPVGRYIGDIGGYNDEATGFYKVYDITPEKVLTRNTNTGNEAQDKANKEWNERNKNSIEKYVNVITNYDRSEKKLNTRKFSTVYDKFKKQKG